MANMIVDERDQKFVLHEMLGIENLFSTERYSGFSREGKVCLAVLLIESRGY